MLQLRVSDSTPFEIIKDYYFYSQLLHSLPIIHSEIE